MASCVNAAARRALLKTLAHVSSHIAALASRLGKACPFLVLVAVAVPQLEVCPGVGVGPSLSAHLLDGLAGTT